MDSIGKMPYALKYGLVLGLLGVVFSIISNLSGLTESAMGSMISVPVMVLIYCLTFHLCYKAFRADNGGMSFGEGLGLGALVSLVAGVISGIFNYVYTTFIDPGMMDRIMEAQYEMLEGYGMSEEQIEQQMEFGQMFAGNPIIAILSAIIGSLCIGFVFSLIMSAIMKKKKTPDWLNDSQSAERL